MTVLLLNCSLSWLKANDDVVPSTGKIIGTDTVRVVLPIDIIRDANIKLNERLILKDINMNLENQLEECKRLCDESLNNINRLRGEIYKQETIIEKYKTDKLIYKNVAYVEGAAIVLLLIMLLCN